ncbi:hypothetical protein ABIE37_000946 [Arthrobacter bambusae]|uniref:Uncharacterized protein n=1 Tax=Arthrobacter bambusae TaxID=1338426 RepID=A0ABV2P356_9MICC
MPTESAIPTPTASLPPEFYDDSARGRYLAGGKKALNAWRDGVIPSDQELIQAGGAACELFAKERRATKSAHLRVGIKSQVTTPSLLPLTQAETYALSTAISARQSLG